MTLPEHMRVPSVRTLMRALRSGAPLSAPVRVVQKLNPACNGQVVLGYAGTRVAKGKPVRFQIVLERRLPAGEKYEVIVHEYAHCLDRDSRPHPVKECHDSRWGACYAQAFRAAMAGPS